jgi:chemotaxis family two-component system response regulator Rcp1
MLWKMAMNYPRALSILQVEDTPSDAHLTAYAMHLADVPHSLHVVTDGSQALDFLKRAGRYADAPRPDLILLDLDLPRLHGSKVLEFIKQDDGLKTIPVIIFSTSDTAESKKHAYELHANSYVVKPMDLAAFTKKVRSIADYWCNTSETAPMR